MSIDPEELRERRVDDCRNLFIKYEGQHHEQIEREMRVLGHTDFHRRSLYDRFERGKHKTGWVARYGFNRALHRHREEISHIQQRTAMYERLGLDENGDRPEASGFLSPAGTKIIAQGKDVVRHPGNSHRHHSDPVGVEQTTYDVAPLQGAEAVESDPGVTRPWSAHPRLLSLSPSATGNVVVESVSEPLALAGGQIVAREATDWPPADAGGSDFPEFQQWLEHVSPGMTWSWKHQVYIYKRLKRVTQGLCNRLMIFVPPRHGKSELVTVRYSAFRLKQDPTLNIIIGCYNQRLANRFSRKMRRVLTDDAELSKGVEEKRSGGEQELATQAQRASSQRRSASSTPSLPNSSTTSATFPFTSRRANSEAEWETSQGGGVRAVGVGGGVTGFGAGLIVIDDPVKSRAEAESQTYRDRVWDWFNDDIYTRLEPNGQIVLIQTRWHEDDLAGRLLREAQEEGGEQWEVVNLPALAEGMSPQGARILAQGKDVVRHPGNGYQKDSDPAGDEQAPSDAAPRQGAEVMEPVPGVTLPSSAHPRLISVSPSATGSSGSPDIVAPLPLISSSPLLDALGRSPGEALCPERYGVEALERLRRKLGSYSFAALYQQTPVPAEGGLFKRSWFKNVIPAAPPGLRWTRGYDLAMTSTTNSDYTASYRTAYDREGNLYIDGGFRSKMEYPEQRKYILGRIRTEPDTQQHCVELSANGNAVIQDLHRDTRALGRALRGVKVEGSKISRALPWIALAEAGKVYLVRGGWNTEFIDEACSFPSGTHDDQIDAVSIAVRMSRQRLGGRAWGVS